MTYGSALPDAQVDDRARRCQIAQSALSPTNRTQVVQSGTPIARFSRHQPNRGITAGLQIRHSLHLSLTQTSLRSTSFNGTWRTRLPVAANIAFNTAGAATAMVGSPTPPQNPPDGITMVSTAGISAMRMER